MVGSVGSSMPRTRAAAPRSSAASSHRSYARASRAVAVPLPARMGMSFVATAAEYPAVALLRAASSSPSSTSSSVTMVASRA